MTQIAIVKTTFEKRDEAERMAHELVEHRLAACVQVQGPVVSVYRWEGKIERTGEYVLSIKAPVACVDKTVTYIKDHHSYDTPEVTTTHAQTTSEYGQWADRACL